MEKVTRRNAREWALQMLCQFDLNPTSNIDEAIAAFWLQQWEIKDEYKKSQKITTSPSKAPSKPASKLASSFIINFTTQIVKGVLEHLDEIDSKLETQMAHWKMYRLGTVERNVLRIGAWELIFTPDNPRAAIINEAVDIAKFFSDSAAGHFINGVLDKFFPENFEEPQQESETFVIANDGEFISDKDDKLSLGQLPPKQTDKPTKQKLKKSSKTFQKSKSNKRPYAKKSKDGSTYKSSGSRKNTKTFKSSGGPKKNTKPSTAQGKRPYSKKTTTAKPRKTFSKK